MRKNKSVNKYIVSFPHMGNYYVPVKYLFKHIFSSEIMVPTPITNKTIELGSKYSPDFVCTPFKYTLGNFIESLEKGANVLIQAGGGCRYGYYSELQEQILKDLGYDFIFVNLISAGNRNLKTIVNEIKKFEPNSRKLKHYIIYLLLLKWLNIWIKLIIILEQILVLKLKKEVLLN